jgi:hypothetical protein
MGIGLKATLVLLGPLALLACGARGQLNTPGPPETGPDASDASDASDAERGADADVDGPAGCVLPVRAQMTPGGQGPPTIGAYLVLDPHAGSCLLRSGVNLDSSTTAQFFWSSQNGGGTIGVVDPTWQFVSATWDGGAIAADATVVNPVVPAGADATVNLVSPDGSTVVLTIVFDSGPGVTLQRFSIAD